MTNKHLLILVENVSRMEELVTASLLFLKFQENSWYYDFLIYLFVWSVLIDTEYEPLIPKEEKTKLVSIFPYNIYFLIFYILCWSELPLHLISANSKG